MAERESISYQVLELAGKPDRDITNRIEQEVTLCYVDAWMVSIFAAMDFDRQKAHAPICSEKDRKMYGG